MWLWKEGWYGKKGRRLEKVAKIILALARG